jgi:hypothetical protein
MTTNRNRLIPTVKATPHLCYYKSRLGFGSRARRCSQRLEAFLHRQPVRRIAVDSRNSQLRRDVERSSRPLQGTSESESTGKRLSINKGTREARLSRVVTTPGRSIDRLRHLPMRQSSGGAPVVVRGVNDVHMAKGCRMIRCWITKVFFNLEAFK